MATNYKNILLKDNSGQVLLPITLSYYVEYKDGMSIKSYLDTLSDDLNNVNGYIDDINTVLTNQDTRYNTLTDSINEAFTYFSSYVQKPVRASYTAFDNESNDNLSDDLKNLVADEKFGYVSAQKAIETLDIRVTSINSYASELGNHIDTIDSDIDELEISLSGIDTRISNIETESKYSYSKINELFDKSGNLDLIAEAIKYSGNVDAGTESLSNNSNVQKAIDLIGSQLKTFKDNYDGIVSYVGVSSITGKSGILVNGKNNDQKQGDVTITLNLDHDKLVLNNGVVTVADTKLSINSSQISDLIPADNINVTYTYLDGDTPVERTKTVQEFYNEAQTTISQISDTVSEIESSYLVSVTGADDSTYARVYTITQGGRNVGTINIPKDQFLKKVDYVSAEDAPIDASDGEYPALVFTWNLPDSDETTGAPTSIVPIASFVDAITSEIASDVTELQTSVFTIESSYITGATINGQAVNVVDHVLQLSYNILYESGNLTDGVSSDFLTANGIILS